MDNKLEFDRELDEYISERRKTRIFHNIVQGLKREGNRIGINPALETYNVSVVDEKPASENKNISQKKGFFERVFGSGREKDESEMNEQLNLMKSDMKQVARIILDIIKKLPPQELSAFKQSDEFFVLKEILKKHNLIK